MAEELLELLREDFSLYPLGMLQLYQEELLSR
jgi:hypothetical protein